VFEQFQPMGMTQHARQLGKVLEKLLLRVRH
jgi:hypothetical protein